MPARPLATHLKRRSPKSSRQSKLGSKRPGPKANPSLRHATARSFTKRHRSPLLAPRILRSPQRSEGASRRTPSSSPVHPEPRWSGAEARVEGRRLRPAPRPPRPPLPPPLSRLPLSPPRMAPGDRDAIRVGAPRRPHLHRRRRLRRHGQQLSSRQGLHLAEAESSSATSPTPSGTRKHLEASWPQRNEITAAKWWTSASACPPVLKLLRSSC